jgi:peroxisomal 3,2-trans-enoyl-CoA isomerase
MDPYKQWLGTFVANNINTTQAFYSHPKILVTALNGPAVGLSAALIGFSDFIYAAPHAFILTPFTSLGLVAEGGASRGFVQRMGIAKANEALIMSKRITSDELVKCGFVNEVFDTKPNEQEKFLELVLKEVDNRLGEHLVSDSMTKIKALIRKPENDIMDAQGVSFQFLQSRGVFLLTGSIGGRGLWRLGEVHGWHPSGRVLEDRQRCQEAQVVD